MKRLYKFDCDGYYFKGLGIFWSTPEQIKKLIGKTVNFGSIAGKHSEVEIELEESMFVDITHEIQNPNFSAGLQPQYYLPQFDFVELEDGTKLTPEDLEDYNDEVFEITDNQDSYYRFFDYEDKSYEVVGSKENAVGIITFLAKEVENE
jgi:hypothetical protein